MEGSMQRLVTIVAGNLVSLCCVVAAGVLAFERLPGWGWFLFVAALTAVNYSFKRDPKPDDGDKP